MPPDAVDPDDIQYILFFIVKVSDSFASDNIAQIDKNFDLILVWILIVVVVGFSIVLLFIQFFAYRTAKRITHAISIMTDYTNKLKKAQDVANKQEIIREICKNDLFATTSKQYEKMKQAKESLIQRDKNTRNKDKKSILSQSQI